MKRSIQLRDGVANIGQRSLNQCSNSAGAQKRQARAVERRAAKVGQSRKERSLTAPSKRYRRDVDQRTAWEAKNHNMTGQSTNGIFSPIEDVFDANTCCVLSPEIHGGPYYVVGEYMRSNVIESEFCDGVPVFLEVQYVDVDTCDGVPQVAVDVWNCNATGGYSGVEFTNNEEDTWSVLQADESYDPLSQFVYLSDNLQDGLLAWIQIGINASADYQTDDYYGVTAYLVEDGGYSTSYTVGGGGGGGGAGNGTMSGAPPPSGNGAPRS